MFNLRWLSDQQDILAKGEKSEPKNYVIPDNKDFVPSPEKDPYFSMRRFMDPEMHKKYYPQRWLSDQQDILAKGEKSEPKNYVIPDNKDFVPSPEKDPYFSMRRFMDPEMHKKYYPQLPL